MNNKKNILTSINNYKIASVYEFHKRHKNNMKSIFNETINHVGIILLTISHAIISGCAEANFQARFIRSFVSSSTSLVVVGKG